MLFPKDFLSQGEALNSLLRKIHEGRMTHALLISGEEGLGKWSLAQALAAALLCEDDSPLARPCGKCRACIQMESLSHPDLIVIRKGAPLVPSDVKTSIPVSDIQEMIRRVGLKGYEGTRRVVLVRHAEDMNDSAQNKMLKTLEEPPEETYFLMTCVNADKLLPTIVSRCQLFKMHAWKTDEIVSLLERKGYEHAKAEDAALESGGSPGRALQIAGDEAYWAFRDEILRDFFGCTERSRISEISSRWKDRKDQADALFSALNLYISRMMHASLLESGEAMSLEKLPDPWKSWLSRSDPGDYVRLLDAVSLARKRLMANVNFQIVVEQLIFALLEALDS